MNMLNRSSKKYYKDLKTFLPLHGKKEKQLFQGISFRLSELNNSNPGITYEEICKELGLPHEIVGEYFDNSDYLYLSKRLRISYYLRNAFIILMIVLLILSSTRIYFLNKAYENVVNTTITHEVETIE